MSNDMARPMSAKQPAPQGLMGSRVQNQKGYKQSQEVNRKSQEDLWMSQEVNPKPRQDSLQEIQKTSEVQRKVPQQKAVTSEEMQRELIQCKQEMNIYSLENIQLRTKIQKHKNDIEKKDKVIASIMEKLSNNQEGNVKLKADPEMGKVLSLKQQVKNLREKVRIKKDIHAEMENYMKTTETEDGEAKVNAAMKDCKDIRLTIEKEQLGTVESHEALRNIRRLERRLQEQNEAIADMRKNNDQLNIKIIREEKNIQETHEKANKLEAQRQKYIAEHKKLTKNKSKLVKAKKEMEELKEQIDYLDTNGERTDTYKERLEELRAQETAMKAEASNKENEVKRLKDETDSKKSKENKKKLKADIIKMQTQLTASKLHITQ